MTRSEMAEYLDRFGWSRRPRSHGDRLEWVDPLTAEILETWEAFVVARGRDRR